MRLITIYASVWVGYLVAHLSMVYDLGILPVVSVMSVCITALYLLTEY